MATRLFVAWVLGFFEATIRAAVALAALMPVVASMGGIVRSQTLTIIIRGAAIGQAGTGNLSWLLSQEVRVGLLNGSFGAVAVVVGLWFSSTALGVVVGATSIANMGVTA